MKYLLIIFPIYVLLQLAETGNASCKISVSERVGVVSCRCTGMATLEELEKARTNTTEIEITDSKLYNVPGHSFARFGATLITLDLHESGIETIESQAFIGLTKLEKLILWGNKLKWVSRDWFDNLRNLRTLDLSFNFIQGIDYTVYQMLPYLENFYFDYNQLRFIDFNMFAYMGSLKKVKFGKNPLNWQYRARLTWQLENQHVQYTEEWEDWEWMNVGIKDCIESGQGELPGDTVLDCLVGKLLDFTYDALPNEMRRSVGCNDEARRLVSCMKPRNSTKNSENETIRRILEDYATILMPMTKSQAPFISPIKQ